MQALTWINVSAQTGAGKRRLNVRFGSNADICSAKRHVRFTSKSRHARCKKECPLSANSGHCAFLFDHLVGGIQ